MPVRSLRHTADVTLVNGSRAWFLVSLCVTACHVEPALDAGVPLACPSTPPVEERSGAPACAPPTPVDPTAATDQARFRANASAAVCDWSLRCGGLVAALSQSFCHPEFAAYRGGDVPHDALAAERCLTALAAATSCPHALDIAFTCLAVSDGATGGACTESRDCGALWEVCDESEGRCRWLGEGEPCLGECGPGLSCIRGECRPSAGCECEHDLDCGFRMGCFEGACRRGLEGEACDPETCAEGLYCDETSRCARAAREGEACGDVPCARGFCAGEDGCISKRHLGCACADDRECAFDVARCVEGVCVARPMRGSSCDVDGAPCFGSGCYDGQCEPFRDGDGPCGSTQDCATGLSCSGAGFVTGLCGSPRDEGEPCGTTLPGACRFGLTCTGSDTPVCTAPAEVGESCVDRPCVRGASCDGEICVAD